MYECVNLKVNLDLRIDKTEIPIELTVTLAMIIAMKSGMFVKVLECKKLHSYHFLIV